MEGVMPAVTRSFRVFVSSTFADFEAEREILRAEVFPRLEKFCRARGGSFQAVDLRWGISRNAAEDQHTMQICFGEIDRCREITKRPNFIFLLGDRYGWRPVPEEIPAIEFDCIIDELKRRRKNSADILTRSYRRDDNAIPARYHLLPREAFDDWPDTEQGVSRSLHEVIDTLGFSPEQRRRYTASATEQEIAHRGLLNDIVEGGTVHGFLRHVADAAQELPKADSTYSRENREREAATAALIEQLKRCLRGRIPQNVIDYTTFWHKKRPSSDYLERLCADVYDRLSTVIHDELTKAVSLDPLDAENLAHREFGEERLKFFIGRTEPLQAIRAYLETQAGHPFVLHGEPGTGKSTLVARAIADIPAAGAETVVSRFIGAVPGSTNVRTLLGGLCRQLRRRYSDDEAGTPTEYSELVRDLRNQLEKATEQRPVIVFLDALDQLSPLLDAHSLGWLPMRLPAHVHIVTTSLPGDCLEALKQAVPEDHRYRLPPMCSNEGENLLRLWLSNARRTLQAKQQQPVLDAFAAAGGRPLHLRLAFEEARLWYSDTPATELAPDIPGLIRQLLARLTGQHGEALVSRSLAYIAAGKNGLSQTELVEVLSRDDQVMAEFRTRSPDSPSIETLPIVVWSRLYLDLVAYLSERIGDGIATLDFFHRQLREVVEENYLFGETRRERHQALARYFGAQPYEETEGDQKAPNLRKLSELPHQQTRGEMWEDLEDTLCSLTFIEAKCSAGRMFELIDDYNAALATENLPHDLRARIEEFARFVQAQSHVLAKFPDLTFQQAYNEPDSTLPARVAKAHLSEQKHGRPFIRQINKAQTPSRCREILVGHADIVNSCDVSRDGKRVVSASSDQELKIWNAESGALLLTLRGHGASVENCVFSPDGSRILSADRDGQLKLWATDSGQQIMQFAGHREPVANCAFSPDGNRVISASYDRTVRIWNTGTGEELRPRLRHRREAVGCAFSPDKEGTRIVSSTADGNIAIWSSTGSKPKQWHAHSKSTFTCRFSQDGKTVFSCSEDGTLKRWDAETCELIMSYEGHRAPVWTFGLSKDGSRLVSGSEDGSVIVWDVATGQQLAKLTGHSDDVWGVAFYPDGKRVASASWDMALRIWDIAGLKTKAQDNAASAEPVSAESPAEGAAGMVLSCNFSPDGRRIAAGLSNGNVRLWDRSTGSPAAHFEGHADYVLLCVFFPCREWLLTGGWDGSLKVFDYQAQQVKFALRGHRGQIKAGTFSRDGAHLASCSAEKIIIWNVGETSIERRHLWKRRGAPFETCALTPDGRRAVVGTEDGKLHLRDVETGRRIISYSGHPGLICAAISPDGTRLVTGSQSGMLKLWELTTGAELATFVGHKALVQACNFSPDGRRVVSASWDRTVRIWDLANPAQPIALAGHTDQLQDAWFSPDGTQIVSAAMDGTLRLWDAVTGCQLGMLIRPTDSVTACAFSQTGEQIVSASHRRAVKLHDGGAGETLRSFHDHADDVLACAFSPDGSRLLSASADKTLKIWDLSTATVLNTLTGHLAPVQSCVFSPDGRFVASGSWDNTVRLWDEQSGAPIRTLVGHKGWVRRVLFTSDSSRLVSASVDGTLRIWDAATGQHLLTLSGHHGPVESVAFLAGEGELVSGSGAGELKVWDVTSGSLLSDLARHNGVVTCCAFSMDGSWLASASMDKTLRLWDTQSSAQRLTLVGHEDSVLTCAFSPFQDNLLASGARDGLVKIWDAVGGASIATYCAGAEVHSLAWHPQATEVVAGDVTGRLHLLELHSSTV
jgi:WD40 repeat protein